MTASRFTKITLAIIFVGLFLMGAAVIVIDPFFHYHPPLKAFPYRIDNQLSQNPGMARNFQYDSIMLGSSMTVNFESDWFKEEMGYDLLKLPYNGAYPRDIKNIMEQVKQSRHRPLRKVYLGVDASSYTGGVDETKYPLPEYLYDNNYLSDVYYLFNKDVLLDYCLKPVIDREPTVLSSVYSSEKELEGCYSKDYVLSNYVYPEMVEAYFPQDHFVEPLRENLTSNILPLIEENPDTEFVIFFPPYSILYWYEYLQYSQWDALVYEYRYLMETLLEYPNVELYFFPIMKDVVTNLDLYADTGHYKQAINHYMVQCFQNGDYRVDKNNLDNTLMEFNDMVSNYDYDGLLLNR